MAEKVPSTPADFAEPETAVIDLPRPGSGGRSLVVKIRAVSPVELVKAMDGVPGLAKPGAGGEKVSFEEARQAIIANDGPSRRVVALGVVEPAFYFGEPEEGKAPWDNVHGKNQAAIVKAIMDLSGFGEEPGGAAAKAAEFRDVAGDQGGARAEVGARG